MKKLLSAIMALCMVVSALTVSAKDIVFTDVAEDAWYYDDVYAAVEMGLINGKTSDTYAPEDNITYAEVLKLAACMHQKYLYGSVSFTNKDGEAWYTPYIDYCKTNGIGSVEENEVDTVATRYWFMTIFANTLPEEAYKPINTILDGAIPDVPVATAFGEVAYKLYRAGIVTGADSDHNCKPAANITRAEVATIIVRMMDESKRVKFEMIETLSNNGIIDNDIDINKGNHTTIKVNTEPTDKPIIGGDVTINELPSIIIKPDEPKYDVGNSNLIIDDTKGPLAIEKQPEGVETQSYGEDVKLEVKVTGGKAPYTYEWVYYAYRNEKVTIENGDYVKDATSNTLVISVEKENTLLGKGMFCKITDSEGTEVKSDIVKVYGPFMMPVEDWLLDSGKYTLVGRIADGVIKKGDKISVERNGKIIAIGTVADLQMFNKSLDEGVKNDNIGLVFDREDGVRPQSGDTVIKYNDSHVIDTSDIVN